MAKVTIPIPKKSPLKNIVKLPEDENVMGAGGTGVGDQGIYGREIKRALRKKPTGMISLTPKEKRLIPQFPRKYKGITSGRDKDLQKSLGYGEGPFARQEKRLKNIEEEQKEKERLMGALAPEPADPTPDSANVALLKGQKADLEDVDRSVGGYLSYPFSKEGGSSPKKLISGFWTYNPNLSFTTRAFLGGINKEGRIEEGKGKVNDPKEFYEFTVQVPWSTKPSVWHLNVPPTEKIRNQLIQQAKDEYWNQSPAKQTEDFLIWAKNNIRNAIKHATGGEFWNEFAFESLVGMQVGAINYNYLNKKMSPTYSRLSGLSKKGGQLRSPIRAGSGRGFIPLMQMAVAMFADWSSEFALQQTGVFPKDSLSLWMIPFMPIAFGVAGKVYRGGKAALAHGPLSSLAKQNRAQRTAVKWLSQFAESASNKVLKSRRMRALLGLDTRIVNSKIMYERLETLYPNFELPTEMFNNYNKALDKVLADASSYIKVGNVDAVALAERAKLFKELLKNEVVTYKDITALSSEIGHYIRKIGNDTAKEAAEKGMFGKAFNGAESGRVLFNSLTDDLDGFIFKHGRGSSGKKQFYPDILSRRRLDRKGDQNQPLGIEYIRAKRAEFREKGLKIPEKGQLLHEEIYKRKFKRFMSEFKLLKRDEVQNLYNIRTRGNLTPLQKKQLANYEYGRKMASARTTQDTARVLNRFKKVRQMANAEYVAADWNDVLDAAGLTDAAWMKGVRLARSPKEQVLGQMDEIDFGKVIKGFRERAFDPDGKISSVWKSVIPEKDIRRLNKFLGWMETQAGKGGFGPGGLVIRGRSANIADRVMSAMLGGSLANSALGAIPTAAAATAAAQLPEILQRWTTKSRLGAAFLENILRRSKMSKVQQVQMAHMMVSVIRSENKDGVNTGETNSSLREFIEKDVPLFLSYINKSREDLFEYAKMQTMPTGGKIDLGVIQKHKIMGTFDTEKEKTIQNYMDMTGADRETAERRMTLAIEQQNEKESQQTIDAFDEE